ncbi:MAG: hypothetical protein ACK4TO_01385 [Candidatus Nitrosotenuis sp.]
MESPRAIPNKLEGNINFWLIAAIVGVVSAFHFGIAVQQNALTYFIMQQFTETSAFATALTAIFVGSTYSQSKVFGRSFIVLGIGYFFIFVGETIYTIQDFVINEDPYPSVADPFFMLAYPFIIAHMFINIRYFEQKIKRSSIFWMAGLGFAMFSSYFLLSLSQDVELNFEFYYGLIFVALPSISIPITVYGVLLFRGGLIGKAWLILLFGNLSNAIGDVWYYHLETLGQYQLNHPVNIFWFFAYWVIVYAIYKHRKYTNQLQN